MVKEAVTARAKETLVAAAHPTALKSQTTKKHKRDCKKHKQQK